jgi:hypothetical protein
VAINQYCKFEVIAIEFQYEQYDGRYSTQHNNAIIMGRDTVTRRYIFQAVERRRE